jgi:hypothetical protein
MKRFIQSLVTGVLSICAAALVHAADFGGVKFEEKATVGGQELVLNGGGVRSRFMVKVYAAGLYAPQKASNANAIITNKGARRVHIAMLRDVPAEQFADALKDGIDNNTPQAELDAMKGEIDQLLGVMRSLKEAKSGQAITLDFLPDGKTTVSVNGAAKGSVGTEPLQRALLKIWLGDKPIQNDLKRGLLGG